MRRDQARFACTFGVVLALLFVGGSPARADTLQAPVGGKPVPLGDRGVARGDNLDPAPASTVPACPLSVLAGPPLRGVDDARIVVRLGGACARDAGKLRFRVRGSRP